MEIYDNADSSYKTAGAETYHLPVLYTEDERSSYAVWGIKKEKLLLPFAVVTIIIDAFVLCACRLSVCDTAADAGIFRLDFVLGRSGR